MIQTNRDKLVIQSVQGEIRHPYTANPYYIQADGTAVTLPAMGGITYNVRLTDCAFGWEADHLEPGVTLKNPNGADNDYLNILSCLGNEATVLTGDAKGAKGFVTGTHGGCEHVLVYFERNDLEKMAVYDKIQIKACGQGMKITGHPEIRVQNMDPELFSRLGAQWGADGALRVPVVAEVPAYLMGSGFGTPSSARGDYDITTTDMQTIRELGLDKLRFGDVVLLRDCDNSYGRAYLKGAVSVGVVIHGNCVRMGHGPGVTTFLTCKSGGIEGVIDEGANIGFYMGVR